LGWEGARSKPSMTTRNSGKRRWGTPDLDLSSGLRFALRREVQLPVDPGPRVAAAAHAVLGEAGFEPVRRLGPSGSSNGAPLVDVGAWVGERGVRRRGGTASTAVVPMITVFVAGCILGGIDAYILGSLVAGLLWALAAAAVSGAFWLRYGRIYDSDLAMVTRSNPLSESPASPGSVSVVFWAARVRSQIHSGVRIPIIVSAPMRLATEIGAVSREFQRRMSEPVGGESSRTVPS